MKVIVGAGPYGLSVAAHLAARGIPHRIFGTPLQTWRVAMPQGMLLKSDGFASDLSSPLQGSRLADYCRERGLPYHDTDIPVRLELFNEYGLEFQQRFVPHLETTEVVQVALGPRGYRVQLADGEDLVADRVVMAVGITHFAQMPSGFEDVDPQQLTHSSAHHTFDRFAGQDVTVVGAGSSAVDVAVELAKAGAHARLVARRGYVKFASGVHNEQRTRWARIKAPGSGLGPGWRSRVCCDIPDAFRLLPVDVRGEIVRRHLGPSSPFHLREAFESTVESFTDTHVRAVKQDGERIRMELVGRDAPFPTVVETDHVICASGYRADLSRLTMIDPTLRSRIRTIKDAPELDRWFESSVRGLHFVGNAAAMSFGPLMRFMYGNAFTSRRVTDRFVAAA